MCALGRSTGWRDLLCITLGGGGAGREASVMRSRESVLCNYMFSYRKTNVALAAVLHTV